MIKVSREESEEGDEQEDDGPEAELKPIFERSPSAKSAKSTKSAKSSRSGGGSSSAGGKSSGSSEVDRAATAVQMEDPATTKPEHEEKVRESVANLFGFLPRPSTARAGGAAPTPDNHQLSSEGLPPGWTMQLMRNGRTLFIDNSNQVTTWIDPRTGRPADVKEMPHQHHLPFGATIPAFESPPSPLSLMDVITVGSPVALDRRSAASASSSSAQTATSPGSMASAQMTEVPQEERLLPVGGGGRPQGVGAKRGEGILDRVWQVIQHLNAVS